MKVLKLILVLFTLIGNSAVLLAQQALLHGTVSDQKGQPLQLANIYVDELGMTVATDYQGEFSILLPMTVQTIHLKVTMVGNISQHLIIPFKDVNKPLAIRMVPLSYTLEEVSVNPLLESTKNSNSSIIFDEEAIEKVQAFSLMDILNTLPGKTTTAPTIDAPQTITFRGNQGEVYDLNNSLGVAIIMDGVNLSNDANMQARSSSQFGMAGSILGGANATKSGDVPFQGIDLRQIPVETIEKVEVIQGVASAQYGELTDGAILIDRKAAKTPYAFVTNVNGGSTNFSLSKGYGLGKRWGALNLGLNYAISNPNPRDKIKQFDRISSSIMWSYSRSKYFKNTFSLDYGRRNDEMKFDPDDEDQQTSYTKEFSLRISNRMAIALNSPLVRQANITLSMSTGSQHSYKQWMLNGLPRGYSAKDTTGIYEGVVLSGRYIAQEEIIGKPVTGSANINLNTVAKIGENIHAISYGLSTSYSNNGGKGIIADPDRPRWVNSNAQNARPYSFQYLDPLINYGFFLTDNFSSKVFNKKLRSNLGMRIDQQNGSWSFQPRLSTVLQWNQKLDFTAAFGIASKSPTMAHRYPAPTFLDIPLILTYNSDDALYLVYTDKTMADNSHLKPSKSLQAEFGVRYRQQLFNTSINAFYKNNFDGFASVKSFKQFTLPEYEYYYDEIKKKIFYNETGKYINYFNYGNYNMGNTLNSKTYGVDWTVNINKIKAIESSFTISNSLLFSVENPTTLDVVDLKSPIEINNENIWYLMYPASSKNKRMTLMSKLSSTTHIPKLGFVIMSNFDLFWTNRTSSKYAGKIQQAVGFIGANGIAQSFPSGIEQIPVRDLRLKNGDIPFIYGCLNLSVAKEIKKRIRIAVTAYNVLDIRPEKLKYSGTNTDIFTVTQYNNPISITGGISLKF